MIRTVPSVAPAPGPHANATVVARQLLARFGDDRYVHRIVIGRVPPITRQHLGYFGRSEPPANAAWAFISAPLAAKFPAAHASVRARLAYNLASWEVGLVGGALRDSLCAARSRPLVGTTLSGRQGAAVFGSISPLGQRFANPTPAEFRARVDAVGRRYGFEVSSLRLLRPLQIAPVLIVRTDRPRKAFTADVAAIMGQLESGSTGSGDATAFEGFYFEAVDQRGPFVAVFNEHRGTSMGGQWAANPCDFPYLTLGLLQVHGDKSKNPCG
ncbi:MAG TPA: hypothetical protein VGM80_05630 [Gaiellaceae bacterium]